MDNASAFGLRPSGLLAGLHFNRALALGSPSAFLSSSTPASLVARKLPTSSEDDIPSSKDLHSSSNTRSSTPSQSPIPPQQEYKCPLCQEVLGSQKEFTQHIRGHNEVKPSPDPNDPTGQAKVYYCCMCRKMLSSFSSLDRHMLVHSGERPFSCEKCGQTFTTNGNMHRHKRTHGSRDSRESDVSSGGSQTSQSKTQGGVTSRGPSAGANLGGGGGPGGRKRKSSVDGLTISGASANEVVKPGGHAKCPICPESFFSELSLESHVQTRHQGQNFQCDECPMLFPIYIQLKQHKYIFHPSAQSNSFPSIRNAFQLAALSSMGGQPPIAGQGKENTSVASSQQQQPQPQLKKKDEKVLDLSSPVKPLSAPQMPLTVEMPTPNSRLSQFTSIEQLTSSNSTASIAAVDNNDINPDENDHLIRDMKLKGEFPCRLCDAVFPNLRALKGHNKEHMDRPPYICNVGTCTYSSNDKSTLARHMRTHTGEKPFECTICNFGFTTKANCERHVKNKHGKSTREEVRDSIIIHESAEDHASNHGDKHLLNTSLTESNGSDSLATSLRENDTPSPAKKRRHESGLGSSGDRGIFAPYRSTMYRPKSSNDDHNSQSLSNKAKDYVEPVDAPLDLSRPNTGDSLKENTAIKEAITTKGLSNSAAMDFTKSLAAMAGIPGLPGQMPFQAILMSQLASAAGGTSFDTSTWAAYLMAHQQQEALRRQREAEIAAAAMASSVAGSKDPTAFLMHLSNLQSFQATSGGGGGPLATSPEKPISTLGGNNNNGSSILNVDQNEKSDCSDGDYKMVIKNGVLMKKQKQRRYRTERPHECEHCNARFTLRSNMDRHIKQQHSGMEGSSCGTNKADEDDREDKQLIIDDYDINNKAMGEKMDDMLDEDDDDEEEEGIDLSSLEAIAKAENSSKPFNTFFDTTDEEGEDEMDEEEINVSDHHSTQGGNDGDSSSITSGKVRISAYSSAPHKIDCPFCSRSFPWISSMKRHILTHTGQKPYKCPECPLWFTTKSNCDRHLVRKHGNNNISTTGSTVVKMQGAPHPRSTNSPLYQRHLNETNGNEGDASSNDEDDQQHQFGTSRDQMGGGGRSTCTSSSKGSGGSSHDDHPFKCYLCDDGGHTTREDALNHLQTAHPAEYDSLATKGAFDCSATEVSSTSPPNSNDLEDNFDQLRGQFPDYTNRRVICLFCMRKFWSAEDLRRHVRTHTGEKPYECDICHRKFTLKHSMLRHKKKHDSGVSSGGEDDTDSEGGHSSVSSAEMGRSSPEGDHASKGGSGMHHPGSHLVKKKKPSLMDKINQLSSVVSANNGTTATNGLNIMS